MQLSTATRGRYDLGSELEVPSSEEEDLNNIKEHKIYQRDTKNGTAPCPTTRCNLFSFTKDTVNREEESEHLGSQNTGGKDPMRDILPPITGYTGRENNKVGS